MNELNMIVDFRRKTVLTHEEIHAIHNKNTRVDLHIFLSLLESLEFDLQDNNYQGQNAFDLVEGCKDMVKELIYEKFNFEELFFKY